MLKLKEEQIIDIARDIIYRSIDEEYLILPKNLGDKDYEVFAKDFSRFFKSSIKIIINKYLNK